MRYQSLRESLERVKAAYRESCTNCGLCVESCALYQTGEWRSIEPHRLQEDRMAVVNGGVVSDAVYRFTFSCSNCAKCRNTCPEGLDPFEFTHFMRMAVVDAGRPAPPGTVTRIPSNRVSLPQVAKALQVKPGEEYWLTSVPEKPAQADTVLFLGCNVLIMPDKVNIVRDIFAKLGLDVPIVGGFQLCCGELDLLAGDPATSERSLRQLVATLARFRPKEVILWCGGCYHRLLHTASELMDVPFRTRHITSFLLDYLGQIAFLQPVEASVTIHDPCNLGRMAGEYEPIRRLLQAIPGVRLVEMSESRAESPCCGSTSNAVVPEVAAALTERALEVAAETGADRLVTICQGCHRRFVRGELNHSFKVENYISLLGEAMGIRHDDRYKRLFQYRDPERVIAESTEYINASDYPRDELERLVRQYFS